MTEKQIMKSTLISRTAIITSADQPLVFLVLRWCLLIWDTKLLPFYVPSNNHITRHLIQDELKITNPFKVLSRVIMSIKGSFKVILSTTKQRTIQFLLFLTIEQQQSTGEQHELKDSWGFSL